MKLHNAVAQVVAGVLVALVAGCCTQCDEDGFVSIFNGRDLEGWRGATEAYGVDAANDPGVLQCFPDRKPPKGKCSDIWTAKEYGDFVVRFEFLLPENGDSGLGLRYDVKDGAGSDCAYHGMCEIQILDDGGPLYYDREAKKCRLALYRYAGSAFGIEPALHDNADAGNFTGGGSYVRAPGVWNFAEVKVVGSKIEVRFNGYLVTKADVSKFKGDGDTIDGKAHPGLHRTRGPVALLGCNCNVKFRNIRIKEL